MGNFFDYDDDETLYIYFQLYSLPTCFLRYFKF